ncbi:MAG: hypothetical protein WC855_01960 [Thermodesulfovibrionales bacterium]
MRYQDILSGLLAMTQIEFSGVVAVLNGSSCLLLSIGAMLASAAHPSLSM